MSEIRRATELTIRIVCFMAIFLAFAAVPYWFDQAFAYSGTVGRSEPEARTAGTLFQCRAGITQSWAAGLLIFSYMARSLQLRFMSQSTWVGSLGRSLVEQVTIGLGCWILLRWTGIPTILATEITRFANQVCM